MLSKGIVFYEGRKPQRRIYIKRNEFIKYIKEHYITDPDFDSQIEIIEHSDVDTELLYEDDRIEVSKFFYSMPLEKPGRGTEILNFSVLKIYHKYYETDMDYEFESYENLDYMII